MLRLMQAGLIAGFVQAIAVTAVTTALLVWSGYGLWLPMPTSFGWPIQRSLNSFTSAVGWIDLLIAIGVALTGTPFVEATAIRIREASRRLRPTEPRLAAKILLSQLCIASAGFAILGTRMPPVDLIEVAETFGCGAAALFVWPGIMSIGVAVFGANAHAAAKAL
jgi:hypothetical protein